jgi:uncharacterized membrane protein YtjA (UPF0391 family)
MLKWIVIFLFLSIIAGLFGFVVIVGVAASIAKLLFYVFLALLVVSMLMHVLKGNNP